MRHPRIRSEFDPAAPDGVGWRKRAKLLVSDLVVFDPTRCNWRYAAATMVGLFLPLAVARHLAMPELSWVGIGAFLLAIGGSVDDDERWRPLRLGFAALVGGLALATGVLAGGHLASAVAGMLFWGFLTALLGVYANPLAAMGLPIAWAYVELGVPRNDHTFGHAAVLGVLFALGGLLTFVITSTVDRDGYNKPLRLRTAACFRALAAYLDALGSRSCKEHRDPISLEMRVRLSIAEARGVAARLSLGQSGTGWERQSYLVLTELADRIFSLAAMLQELPDEVDRSADKPSLALIEKGVKTVIGALSSKPNKADLRSLLAELELERDHAAFRPANISYDVNKRIADELIRALRVILSEGVPPSAFPVPVASSTSSPFLAPLIGCLRWDSVVGRHALRFAVASSAAVVLFWVFPPPFGYWIPLTLTAVLKPYAGVTLARTVQRVAGTLAGIVVGMAIMALVSSAWAHVILIAFAFFCMMFVLPANYSLAIFFLSVGLIPYEHLSTPGFDQHVGALRLAATGIGATIALVSGHLLWPTFERETLPGLTRTTICSLARFAENVLHSGGGRADLAAISDLRRQFGLDMTNLQAALQHSLSEVGGNPETMQATMRAATALQRLFLTLNAIMNADAEATPGFANASATRDDIIASIYLLVDSTALTLSGNYVAPDSCPAVVSGRQTHKRASSVNFLDRELDRALSEVTMLQSALYKIAEQTEFFTF